MNMLFESWADQWLAVLWRASIDGAWAILLATAAVLLLARLGAPAWVEHWLWKLVLLKLVLALIITQPIQLPLLAPEPTTRWSQSPLLLGADPVVVESPARGRLPASATITDDRLAAEAGPAARNWQVRWQIVLAAAWLLGAVANLLILLRQLWAVRRLSILPATDSWLITTCRELAESQRLRRVPDLAISDQVSSPALVGWRRPMIVFPPEALQQCTREQLRGVLGHELSHYRRGDLWWNLLPAAAQVVFYFHPLLWLATRRWRLASEMACDASAIENSVSCVSEYADGLLRIAQFGSHRMQSRRALGCVAVFDSSRFVKKRLLAIKAHRPGSTRDLIAYGALIVIVALLGTLPWQVVGRADEPKPGEADGVQLSDAKFGQNMGFDERADTGQHAKHWGGGGQGYTLDLDDENPHSGASCGRIKGSTDSGFGTYTQCIEAKELRGKRVRYRGYLRSDLQDNGGLWMRIDADQKPVGFDNMHDRRVKGATDWTQYQIVLDVPDEATKICFGFLMIGRGNLWADDFRIEVVDDSGEAPETTGMKPEAFQMPQKPANLDFEQESEQAEQGAKAWGGGGRGYELVRDTSIKHAGNAGGRIRRVTDEGGFGTFTQMFVAEDYKGKRVRLSGYLKTQQAAMAGLWMRIDGPGASPLGFDNMSNRAVKGDTDWTQYSVVLDVPEDATYIALGFLLIGDGTAWGDDLKFEAVGNLGEGPETTSTP